MADSKCLERAEESGKLADVTRQIKAELQKIEAGIESQIKLFQATHRGETPDMLRLDYFRWRNYFGESVKPLDSLVEKCETYSRQQRDAADNQP